jgi:hypothetical protein
VQLSTSHVFLFVLETSRRLVGRGSSTSGGAPVDSYHYIILRQHDVSEAAFELRTHAFEALLGEWREEVDEPGSG